MTTSTQRIFRVRRDYNTWVANETLEDYSLRYTPRAFRKWSEFRVANTAFGAVSFLAMEAIGGTMVVNYGFANALLAILVVGLLTFLTGLPISYYAARYGVDMDLLTRGAGFGYLGSTITSLIYASFTFIFFALEAAIMALALQLAFGWPIEWCYIFSALVILPLVTYGITLISHLQWWTQPLWLVLWLCPFAFILFENPGAFRDFVGMAGQVSGDSGFDWKMFGLAAAVAFSLIVQVGEQVDFLRFLPERTARNRKRWWAAVLIAGPGWIVPGMLKMLGGAFLAFLALQHEIRPANATEPTQMYLAGFGYVFSDPAWVMLATTVFVIVSQVKINVTNAYAGSLAWSNFFARATHSHPGRVVWLVFNVLIATLLMLFGVFHALEPVLGLYANVAVAWVGALVADLVINKPLGLSPPHIEFKRAHLYDINPVGPGAMLVAAVIAIVAYSGHLGETARAYSPFIALFVAFVTAPLIAWATKGRFYLARSGTPLGKPGEMVECVVCENHFEADDMARCPAYAAPICSLCCTLESRCHDRCKTGARAAEQAGRALARVLPRAISRRINFRVGHYALLLAGLSLVIGTVLGLNYYQASVSAGFNAEVDGFLRDGFGRSFAMLALLCAVGAWWMVLASESRRLAEDESNRQNQLLSREIEAHLLTDAQLQLAKEAAESANRAKTRYVSGVSHELRTPLNSILGYAQVLLHDDRLDPEQRRAISTIHRSGEHLTSLIDGLLDLARIEAGRLRLDPSVIDLPEFIDDLQRMVAPLAIAKQLEFRVEVEGSLPGLVRADLKRLRQILINLLINAVKFTAEGSVVLRVDYRMDVARFEVIDTGVGIEKEDLERIFLPFERAGSGRRGVEPGTGLGLTITQLLTELMGGEIRVDSTPGTGSRFTVRLYLPAQTVDEAGTEVATMITGYAGGPYRVLIVDDQVVHRQLIAGMLSRLGFVCAEAASGRECLAAMAVEAPHAVLLDISMDDLDGWETARRLRAAGHTQPIVMVSANVFDNRGELLEACGCQGFVSKPVLESELLALLGRHLQIHWIRARLPPRLPLPAAPPPNAFDEEQRLALNRLLRLGHVQGLRREIQLLAADHPPLAAACRHLAELVDRYDLQACQLYLEGATP
ncbi:ATP-binding protein [Pseudothauera rhizosphaerae]|uniref:Virulence sensor protein BvgS n=1 Tax=Pseudothauera rhizosphaerae TaxID=2565932 RepID=A0A4S4AJ80_9RHOO|nr:ATP-binding protein [Pseudothauera rhizosphaerae]THF59426.1 response regulator [Pseudothauera rhizosphaerae]